MKEKKKDQKQVILTGFRAKNYKTIEAVNFTYDLLQNKIINIVGEIGSSKTSILECVEIALTGLGGISKKDTVQDGFLAELQLTDGDTKLWLGVKTRKKTRGENEGEMVIETFIYTKDEHGAVKKNPIIDGESMSAKDYIKILNSDLSFNLKDLFSKNATTHRKFIEKIYSSELEGLGVDEVIARIKAAKIKQDQTRALCEAVGAFKTTFKAEGYSDGDLEDLGKIDIEAIRKEQMEKEIAKDRISTSSKAAEDLIKANAQTVRNKNLDVIKNKATKIVEKIRTLNEKKDADYTKSKEAYKTYTEGLQDVLRQSQDIYRVIEDSKLLSVEECDAIRLIVKDSKIIALEKLGKQIKEPIIPRLIPIRDGRADLTVEYDKEYKSHVTLLTNHGKDYRELKATPLRLKKVKPESTVEIEKEIEALKIKLKGAEENNTVYDRYNKWLDWIEAKGLYQKEIDTLRKIYAKVDTGVKGLSIVPKEEASRVDVWLMYNGDYDTKFFSNKDKELRYITEYSESQRGIIAVLLQAARLDKKNKALRLALIDSTPFYTKMGMNMLRKIQEEKNIHLITTHTSDSYDKEDLPNGTVAMEGGEAFFKIKK